MEKQQLEKFSGSVSVSRGSRTKPTLRLLVEGFEMTDHPTCHFERNARNLS